MGLLELVLILFAAGALMFLVNRAPFVDAEMKPVIRWVILAAVVLWLLFTFLGDIRIPIRQ